MPDDLYELSRDIGRIARVFHGVHNAVLQDMIHHKLKINFLAQWEAGEFKSPRDLPVFMMDQFDKLPTMSLQQISQSWDKARQHFEDRERFRLMPVRMSAGWRV